MADTDRPRGGQSGARVLSWHDSPITPGETTFDPIAPTYTGCWGEVAVGDVLYLHKRTQPYGLTLVRAREELPK